MLLLKIEIEYGKYKNHKIIRELSSFKIVWNVVWRNEHSDSWFCVIEMN